MSLVVKNNLPAQLALGELNKNVNKVGVLLGKVSSGQKINSAKDDAGQFAISEKMREQIRTMLQDNQNVQNGSSMLKVAEGGVNNIVEELRNLKELAINSANDTNTNVDRLTIQKEFDQKKANINDIATTTNYNGKPLLDGRYNVDRGKIWGLVPEFHTITDGDVYTPQDLTTSFTPLSNTIRSNRITSYGGKDVNSSFQGTPGTSGGFGVIVDFSAIKLNPLLTASEALDGKGFSIYCGACNQYVNFLFDASKNVSTYDSQFNPNIRPVSTQYVIGIKDLTSLSDLPATIFDGILSSRGYPSTTTVARIDSGHNLRMLKNSDGTYSIVKDGATFDLQFYGSGVTGPDGIQKPHSTHTYVTWKKVVVGYTDAESLKIHHGTKANQATEFFINDMHTKSLGTGELLSDEKFLNEDDEGRYWALSQDKIKQNEWLDTLKDAQDKNLDQIDVKTRHNANVAIRVLDGAIEYALNESTRLGSYLQRLNYTDANVTTMSENIQGAESTIRDADMAKEMTDYTKSNVLVQSAQAMLAQANQNLSQTLSLLQ